MCISRQIFSYLDNSLMNCLNSLVPGASMKMNLQVLGLSSSISTLSYGLRTKLLRIFYYLIRKISSSNKHFQISSEKSKGSSFLRILERKLELPPVCDALPAVVCGRSVGLPGALHFLRLGLKRCLYWVLNRSQWNFQDCPKVMVSLVVVRNKLSFA